MDWTFQTKWKILWKIFLRQNVIALQSRRASSLANTEGNFQKSEKNDKRKPKSKESGKISNWGNEGKTAISLFKFSSAITMVCVLGAEIWRCSNVGQATSLGCAVFCCSTNSRFCCCCCWWRFLRLAEQGNQAQSNLLSRLSDEWVLSTWGKSK